MAAYCEKCGAPVECNLDDKGKHKDSSKYYFRCTAKDCPGWTGVAVVRDKPVEDKE